MDRFQERGGEWPQGQRRLSSWIPRSWNHAIFICWRKWKLGACSHSAGIHRCHERAAEVACGNEADRGRVCGGHGQEAIAQPSQCKVLVSGQAHESCELRLASLPSLLAERGDGPAFQLAQAACPPREEVGEGTGVRPGCLPPRRQLVDVRLVGGGYRATPPPSLQKHSKKLSPFIVFTTGCFQR